MQGMNHPIVPGPTPVRVWIDPGCPWAYQTSLWLHDLRQRGVISPTWSIFSLEINALEPEIPPFWEACQRQGEALVSLALARREGGTDAFQRLHTELGSRLHIHKEEPSPDTLRAAASDAGMTGLPDRAISMPELVDEVMKEFRDARDLDVFGVPTLKIDADKVVYGPLVAVPPTGDDALALWEQARGLSAREDFFELKRWPRDIRPGTRA